LDRVSPVLGDAHTPPSTKLQLDYRLLLLLLRCWLHLTLACFILSHAAQYIAGFHRLHYEFYSLHRRRPVVKRRRLSMFSSDSAVNQAVAHFHQEPVSYHTVRYDTIRYGIFIVLKSSHSQFNLPQEIQVI